MTTPHRTVGVVLVWLSAAVLLASFVDVVFVHFTTKVALLMPLAMYGIIEGIAIIRNNCDTISENEWHLILLLQDMNRQQRALVFALCTLFFVGGHFIWQSDRTWRDLRCERGGGYMMCIQPSPAAR